MNKCNGCIHKSDEEIYDYKVCIRCIHNPFAAGDKFTSRKPQIVPKEAGEVWKLDQSLYAIGEDESGLYVVCLTYFDPIVDRNISEMVHGKKRWQRLRPEVPDPNIEKVVIKATWKEKDYMVYPTLDGLLDHRVNFSLREFVGNTGKLTFEWNKEEEQERIGFKEEWNKIAG